MIEYGDLHANLHDIRNLLDARWVAVAWKGEDGNWLRHVRGREEMLPQAQRKFFEQLESVVLAEPASTGEAPGWNNFLAAWRVTSGYHAAFEASGAVPAYFAILGPAGDTGDAHMRSWVDLTLRTIISAEIDRERARVGISRQQAVLESAASLLTAASEDDVIPRGLGLAMRLVDAHGAAFYRYDDAQKQFVPAFVRADGPLHEALRNKTCGPDSLCAEARRTGKVQWQQPPNPPDGAHMIRSAVAVPMTGHEGFQGILFLAGSTESDFDDLDINTLTLFGRQLAGVLENLRLLRKLRVANQELSQTQVQLVESARLSTLAEMAGGVAHDFNNILGALLGRVQLLQTRATDANILKGLGKMERLIGEGEFTVRRLQEAARVRKNDPAGPKTIDTLAREVFGAAELALNNQAQIDDRQLTWQTDFHPTGVLTGAADQLRGSLRRFLTQLSQCAPVGSHITFATDCDDISNLIRFAIQLPPSAESNAWQWSAIEEEPTLQKAIAHLDGHIDTTPGSDREPRYTIRFSPAPPAPVEEDAEKSGSFRVLVVDDDSEVRDVLEELLRLDGHHVTSAVDGTQALELFAPDKYDFVFTDLGMPGISGWQVAESIKKDAPDMPVVMVTGWGAQLDPEKVKTSGVDKVLTKPFQWIAVRETLAELMSRKA